MPGKDDDPLAGIADALDRLATIAEKFLLKTYPEKALVRDAQLTRYRTAEQQQLDATLQGEERTLDEWAELGPREKAFLEKEEAQAQPKKPAGSGA